MQKYRQSLINIALRKVLKRLPYPVEVMLVCVRWYVAYPLSLRHIEEMMQERGVCVDHTTVHRWAIKMLPVLATIMRCRKRVVGRSWRFDETYIKVSGQWKYLYRAVDKCGDTVDFLFTAKRDKAAARRFLERAIALHDVPEKITIDKSGANTAAIESVKADAGVHIALRQSKYISTIMSSRTTGPSSESPDPCLASSHSGVPELLSLALKPCTCSERGSYAATKAKLRPQQINSIN